MPKKKSTLHHSRSPSPGPHRISARSKNKALEKNHDDSNSTQRSSNSDELAVALSARARRSRPKPGRQVTPEIPSDSSHSDSNHQKPRPHRIKKNFAQPRNISSAPPGRSHYFPKVIEPKKAYSKTLASLGRPLSRVATAFIADIIAPPAPYPKKIRKKPAVKFDFDVLDINEPPSHPDLGQGLDSGDGDESSRSSDKVVVRGGRGGGGGGATAVVKTTKNPVRQGQGRGHRGQAEGHGRGKHARKSKSESSESEDESSTSNSDAEPPADPTAHIGMKLDKSSPYYQPVTAPTPRVVPDLASSFVSKNQLSVKNLPLPTTIEDLKKAFPKATAIKLILTRDSNDKYRRSATIEFANTNAAKRSYNLAKDTRILDSVIEFDQHKVTLRHDNVETNGNAVEEEDKDSNNSEETLDDFLPQEKVDKDLMVREWIKIQSQYATKSRSFINKYKL